MSQHHLQTTSKIGEPMSIMMGWDRQLSQFFLVVERLLPEAPMSAQELDAFHKTSVLYSSDEVLDRPTLDELRGALEALGLQAPASMYEQVAEDKMLSKGNRIAVYQLDGSFVDAGRPEAFRQRG